MNTDLLSVLVGEFRAFCGSSYSFCVFPLVLFVAWLKIWNTEQDEQEETGRKQTGPRNVGIRKVQNSLRIVLYEYQQPGGSVSEGDQVVAS